MADAQARPESANNAGGRQCRVCGGRYTHDASHVATDAHLEAMAVDTIREWLTLPIDSPESIGLAAQVARLEYFWDDYHAWRKTMGLADTPETLVLNRRIGWVWIKTIEMPDAEARLAPGRHRIEAELGGGNEALADSHARRIEKIVSHL